MNAFAFAAQKQGWMAAAVVHCAHLCAHIAAMPTHSRPMNASSTSMTRGAATFRAFAVAQRRLGNHNRFVRFNKCLDRISGPDE
jgi:hypothetical protein